MTRNHLSRRAAVTLGLSAALLPRRLPAITGTDALADAARVLDQLHSITLTHGSDTLLAEAFRGPGLRRLAQIKSVSKTLVALLAGQAIADGAIESLEAPALPLLGRPAEKQGDHVTFDHLLSMRSGFQSTSGRNYGSWVSSRNWVDFALNRERLAPPGSRFIYSTGSFHLAGVAMARATGRSLLEQARDGLGEPLGIEIPGWVRDPQGYYLGGNEMALTPEALVRIGQMVLAEGRWNDTQVISESWLTQSFTSRARSPFSGDLYGLGWFLTDIAGTRAAYGRGYGGQLLMVFPDRNAVLVITSDPTRPARSAGYFADIKRLAGLAVAALPA